jgi:hypothetical protein
MTKLVVTKTAVAAPVVAGATTGEAVVVGGATATTWGAATVALIPPLAAGLVVGCVIGAALDWIYPSKRSLDRMAAMNVNDAIAKKTVANATTPEECHTAAYLDPFDNFAYKEGMKSRPGIPQPSHNAPNNNSSNSPNPKKPDEPKERRKQPLSKTEAYAKIKDRYEHFEGNKYRIRDGKDPIKIKGKSVERVEWDHSHGGEWEAYPKKKGGDHMGALDPETLELYKPPVKGRTVKD